MVPAVAPEEGGVAVDGAVVAEYSNSSSAPNSASSTFLRRPSLSAIAAPAPTISRRRPVRFLPLRFLPPRSASAADFSSLAAF